MAKQHGCAFGRIIAAHSLPFSHHEIFTEEKMYSIVLEIFICFFIQMQHKIKQFKQSSRSLVIIL